MISQKLSYLQLCYWIFHNTATCIVFMTTTCFFENGFKMRFLQQSLAVANVFNHLLVYVRYLETRKFHLTYKAVSQKYSKCYVIFVSLTFIHISVCTWDKDLFTVFMDQADGWCRPNQDAMVELLALLGNQTCALLGMYILTKPVWVMLLKEDNTSRRQQIFRILLCNLCGFFLSQFSFDTLIVLDVFKLKLSLTSSDVGVYARISYAVQVICTNISFRDFDVLSSCPKCQCWDRTGKWGKEYQKTSDSKIQKRSAQKKVKVLPFVISCDIARYCPQSPNTANIMNTSLSTKNSKPAKQRKESLKFSNVINVSSLKTSFAAGNSIESIFQNPALTAELHSLTAKRFCPEVSLFLEAVWGTKKL